MGDMYCCPKNKIPEIEIYTGTSTNDSSYIPDKREQKINNKQNSDKDKQISLLQNKINEYMKLLNNKENIISKLKKDVQTLRDKQAKNNNKKKSKGLDNIGATCYMNATLQCLSNTKKLREYFENKYKNSPNKTMSNEFFTLIHHLFNENDNKKSYSPYPFKEILSKENPLFAGVQANDSKDLINFLLEKIHQETNVINNNINNNNAIQQQDQTNENLMLALFLEEFSKKFNSPISNLFYGLLETKTQCKGCNSIKFNFHLFLLIHILLI